MGRPVRAAATRPALVELRLAGTFGVIRDGTELAGGEIGSRKSRTLLKLLAVQRPGWEEVERSFREARDHQRCGETDDDADSRKIF